MSNEELDKAIETAKAAVNNAINHYGYAVGEILDTQLVTDYGEAWFIIDSTRPEDKPHKDFFEACYYISNPKYGDHKAGDIIYGIQTNDNWNDLPNNPERACEEFRKYNEAE